MVHRVELLYTFFVLAQINEISLIVVVYSWAFTLPMILGLRMTCGFPAKKLTTLITHEIQYMFVMFYKYDCITEPILYTIPEQNGRSDQQQRCEQRHGGDRSIQVDTDVVWSNSSHSYQALNKTMYGHSRPAKGKRSSKIRRASDHEMYFFRSRETRPNWRGRF